MDADRLDKIIEQLRRDERKQLEESWQRMKKHYRRYRERLKKDPEDVDALKYDRLARRRFGDLYDAEFRGEEEVGQEKPVSPARTNHQAIDEDEGGQKHSDRSNSGERHSKRTRAQHGVHLGSAYSWEEEGEARKEMRKKRERERWKQENPPSIRPRSDLHWGDESIWLKEPIWIEGYSRYLQKDQLSTWYASLDTGSSAGNYLVLAGALALLVYYRRGARSVLWTSAQLVYLTPWLAVVLTWEAAQLLFHYVLPPVVFAAILLFLGAWDYVLVPAVRWLGRELGPVAYWTAFAVTAAWAVWAALATIVWLRWPFVYTAITAALVAGGWALQAYVVAPAARAVRERVFGPRVYWVAVAIFSIWVIYGALWLKSLWWLASPTTPIPTDPPLSLLETIDLHPDVDPEEVVAVRTVWDALGKHANERLFEYFLGRWEKRFMDWFVDVGYVLRPCHYVDCIVPDDVW
ncbi:hypothetical protein PG990_010076 [Apiospora arundinis]